MKYLKQFGIIMGITCIGEILRYVLPLPVPGSIYGLVILFTLLCTHVLKLEDVKDTAIFLIEIMPVMFIPSSVSLIDSWDVLKPMLLPLLFITVVTTIAVMVVTGHVSQLTMKLFNQGKEATHE